MARKKRGAQVRPIRTKRDYAGASAVVKRMAGQDGRDTDAELRLQSLLRELDKFDELEEEGDADAPAEYEYSGPRRRWSDDG
jgi:hypothetical protein